MKSKLSTLGETRNKIRKSKLIGIIVRAAKENTKGDTPRKSPRASSWERAGQRLCSQWAITTGRQSKLTRITKNWRKATVYV